MEDIKNKVRERFIRYAKIDTQSQAGSSSTPSTKKQFEKRAGGDGSAECSAE